MELEILLIKLASITKEDSIEKEILNIEFQKIIKESKESKDKYWESGTGYGHDSTKNWDITAFIKEQENNNTYISPQTQALIDKINGNKTSNSWWWPFQFGKGNLKMVDKEIKFVDKQILYLRKL